MLISAESPLKPPWQHECLKDWTVLKPPFMSPLSPNNPNSERTELIGKTIAQVNRQTLQRHRNLCEREWEKTISCFIFTIFFFYFSLSLSFFCACVCGGGRCVGVFLHGPTITLIQAYYKSTDRPLPEFSQGKLHPFKHPTAWSSHSVPFTFRRCRLAWQRSWWLSLSFPQEHSNRGATRWWPLSLKITFQILLSQKTIFANFGKPELITYHTTWYNTITGYNTIP